MGPATAALTPDEANDASPAPVPSRPRSLSSHGTHGDALIAEVRASLDTLEQVLQHSKLLGHSVTAAVKSTLAEVRQRLARTELCVAIVGEPGSGKRTFLSALAGDRRLGRALRGTRAIVVLRQREAIDYRARLAGDRVEEFSREVPDRRADLERALGAAQAQLEGAQTAAATAAAAAEQAADEKRRASEALTQAFAAFERTREEAVRVSAELAASEAAIERARSELLAVERGVPAPIRGQPAWWALWLWLWRVVFTWIWSDRYRRYQKHAHARDAALQEVASARWRSTENAHECRLAEAALGPLGTDADARRTEARAASAARDRAEAALDLVRAGVEAARSEVDRHARERNEDFFARIGALVRAGNGTTLREIEIDVPARLLPEDVAILSVPDVTDVALRQDTRALSLIRDRADGCVLISDLDRAVSGMTSRFLHQLRNVVPHVLLVLTKIDVAYLEAVRRGRRDPWEEVERARRIGTQRFSQEIGRDPKAVLSMAVAARAALEDDESGLARRFDGEAQKLFQLLRHERAIMLGTRAARTIRGCISELGDPGRAALQTYREQIARLEAERTPPPDEFQTAELAASEPRTAQAAHEIVGRAVEAVHEAFVPIGKGCRRRLERASGRREVLAAARQADVDLSAGVSSAWTGIQEELEADIDERVRQIELDLFAELRRRYRLADQVRRSQSSMPRLEQQQLAPRGVSVMLSAVQADVTRLGRTRLAVAVAGAGLGALIGALIASGLGALIGIALGALFGLVPVRGWISRRAMTSLERALGREEQQMVERVEASEPAAERAIREALRRSFSRAVQHSAKLIAELIEAEAEVISREREALENLERLAQSLAAHDEKLSRAIEVAVDASVGLCR